AYALRLGIQAVSIRPNERCTHFTDSGYVRLQQSNAVALLDVARIGPDYLPGHAHADTLSFELSLFGQRVVVNSGISQYGLGAERLCQRGTAAHSTVDVNGCDSSEVWGGFRVARRARPFGLAIEEGDHALTVTCSHDGYRRLPGKPIHRRSWRLDDHAFQVCDFIEGDFQTAVARYFVHSSVRVSGEGKKGQLQLSDGRVMHWSVAGGVARVVAASWYPEFGLSIPCERIEVLFDGPEARFEFAWD
ncbi:MAG: heparinase II/III-family protein, partial [Methylococcaceae bacterium]|nr:heparinase II/III-family protein [Methylococcaceae bacterium]